MKIILVSKEECSAYKNTIKQHLLLNGVDVLDLSPADGENIKNAVECAAKEMRRGTAGKAVFISNLGFDMVSEAKKQAGLYASCCKEPIEAEKLRKENLKNILCIGAKATKIKFAVSMADVFVLPDLLKAENINPQIKF